MKRLKGTFTGRSRDDDSRRFECDEITLELEHGRELTVRRVSVSGEDGVQLLAGISREERTANARFVVRAPNFGVLHLSIEQGK